MNRPPKIPTCSHAGSNFKCSSLRGNDALSFVKSFHSSKNKSDQDSFIVAHTRILPPVRTNRKKSGIRAAASTFCMSHFVKKTNETLIKVCQETFLGLLDIKVYILLISITAAPVSQGINTCPVTYQ